MTSIRKLLADNIRNSRHEMGLSQAKLAEKADTATHYIAMIEGCKNFPSPEMIEKIAACLGKDSADLFSITPIKHTWKKEILTEINHLITTHIENNSA